MSQQGLRQQWTRDGLRLLAVAAALFIAVWGTDLGIAALPQAFDGGAQGAVEGRQPAGRTWAYVDSAALIDSGAVDLSGTSLYDDVPTYETLEGNDLAARVQRVRAGMGPLLDAQVHDGMAAIRLRELAAMLGAQFTWDGAGTALMTGMDGVIELTPGRSQARRNYTPVPLPGSPVVAGHDLFIPVRSAASALGLELKQEHDGAVVTLSRGPVAFRAIIPSQAFAIEIDRSERWLRVSYAGQLAKHYPACTGEGQNTPVGRFHIQNKCVWPGWRAYWGEFIPGGTSRNPLGARFMGTSARGRATGWTIGIHGTNQPSSIGRRISGGCVRLHNRDIVELYEVIPIGTRVTIHE